MRRTRPRPKLRPRQSWRTSPRATCRRGSALRRALPIAVADTATFHAYLQVPEAFSEVYLEEFEKLNEHRGEMAQVKRVLKRGPYARRWRPLSRFYTALLIAYAITAVTLMR